MVGESVKIVQINTLKNDVLKQLLRERNLVTTGTKAELIQRLTDATGGNEIEVEEPETAMQEQINQLRAMLENLVAVVKPRVSDNQSAGTANAADGNASGVNVPVIQQSASRNSYSVKEIAETIPEFDPTNEMSLSAEQFVDRVNTAMEAYEWQEKSLLLAVYSKLKGVAKLWLDASLELYPTWEKLAKSLIDEFGTTLDEAEIQRRMQNAARKQNELIQDYCFRICALGRRFKLSESAIIKYTRDGLRNRELQSATAALRFTSVKEMRDTFAEFLRNVPTLRQANLEHNVSKTKTQNVNEVTKLAESMKSKVMKCYNCFEPGHISSKCQKPPRIVNEMNLRIVVRRQQQYGQFKRRTLCLQRKLK